ncbi:GtrA family protein [Clostridium sp. MT-14]|jgi:putative flippase GtrA|uniref:GtrA family protein n=1 Tax=Clostridium aromativorans TaxID=2836848 RepID=A0ABS8N3E3_9CLOT|nr:MULTISPECIES: GtrA family protein [Clostridium]KAA8679353.1 GtrA family protein [Clostridium sp. HV4-5-A1G]MCC9294297.1 GtrA family protein [Clostridium aromativorans]
MNQLIKTMDSIFNGRLKLLSRFSTTGVLNTIIDFLVFTLCQSVVGLYYTVSQIIGYSCGVINSFVFNKKWTFQYDNPDKNIVREVIQFVLVNVLSLFVTVVLMKFLIDSFNFNVYVSKVVITLAAQVINFVSYKLWVFN